MRFHCFAILFLLISATAFLSAADRQDDAVDDYVARKWRSSTFPD